MARRVPTTLIDYVVVGINPALIMLLIASVMCFLVEVFYQGDYNVRLKFIFFMFIMGAVAVGRLSMEEGVGYAASFGIPLGAVAFLGINTFVTFEGEMSSYRGLINLVLIGLIWFLSLQLTWDCTLLDERTDTADQGLLAAIGADQERPDDATQEPETFPESTEEVIPKRPLTFQEDPIAWWLRYWERNKRPHAHGVWIVYFACVALPLFGLGGWFLSREMAARQSAFSMLVLFVASSLGLLLSTSFLGLRRYLRLRNVEMPLDMTATWLAVGGALILGVLLVCLVLPRPGAEVAISKIPFPAISPQLNPTRWNWGNDGKKERDDARASSTVEASTNAENEPTNHEQNGNGAGNAAGQAGQNETEQSAEAGPGEQAQGKQGAAQQGESEGSSASQGGNSGSGEKSAAQDSAASPEKAQQQKKSPADKQQSSSQSRPAPSKTSPQKKSTQKPGHSSTKSPAKSTPAGRMPSSPTNPMNLIGWVGTLFKLVLWGVLLAIVGYYAWKHREAIQAAWQQLLQELQALWARLMGARDVAVTTTPIAPPVPEAMAFSAFGNPFRSGQAQRMTPRELLQYTFHALQAYGREIGCPRFEHETPHEYVERLAVYAPDLELEMRQVIDYYGYEAYAGSPLPATFRTPLQSLWNKWNTSTEQTVA
jgi:hypothetical protein